MKFTNYLLLERNIFNIEDIDKYIKYADFVYSVWGRDSINKWIKSNLKNYLLREYPIISIIKHIDKDQILPWMQKALDKNDLYHILITQEFKNQVEHIMHYFYNNPDLNISRMSVPEARRQAERWVEDMNKKASDKEDVSGTEEVRKYPDGFRWVKVISKQSLDREGKLMKHCVGSYCNQVSSGSSTIYSLRDKKNEPHCTIELKGSVVNQIKGKANGPVDDKYRVYVKDFIMKPITEKIYPSSNDLHNIGLIKVDDKYYELDNLPENLHVKGDLDLDGSNITSLPKGLRVEKNLYLNGTNITSLPEDLKVKGSLYVECATLVHLSSGIYVGEHLSLSDCINLKTISKGLQVGKSLNFARCIRLTSLPDDLKVGGYLDLYACTGIKSLPENLYVGGFLELENCTGLMSLPKGLQVEEYLILVRCKNIKTLPDDLKVGGKIYISADMKKYFENSKFKDQIRI